MRGNGKARTGLWDGIVQGAGWTRSEEEGATSEAVGLELRAGLGIPMGSGRNVMIDTDDETEFSPACPFACPIKYSSQASCCISGYLSLGTKGTKGTAFLNILLLQNL